MISTEMIDVVYEICEVLFDKDGYDKTFKANGVPYKILVKNNKIQLNVHNSPTGIVQYPIISMFNTNSIFNGKWVFISSYNRDLYNLKYVTEIASHQNTNYKIQDMVNLSSEQRFFHELNTPERVLDVIDFNEYIKSKSYDFLYRIHFCTEYSMSEITDILKCFCSEL